MPVHVNLDENKEYLIYSLSDPLKIEELLAAYRQEKEYRDSLPYTLHSIVDMSTVKRIPPNWLLAKAGPGLTHPRSGEILIVGVSRGLKILLETILKITNFKRMRFFVARPEADVYLRELLARSKRPAAAGK